MSPHRKLALMAWLLWLSGAAAGYVIGADRQAKADERALRQIDSLSRELAAPVAPNLQQQRREAARKGDRWT